MRCLYINLDQATERRASLEAGFAATAPAGWTLERIPALGPADAGEVAGSLAPAAKAAALSHKRAIGESLKDAGPTLVVEDDVIFSPKAFAAFDRAAEGPWDLVLGDITAADAGSLTRLAALRGTLAAAQRLDVLDLAGLHFAGAASYVLTPEGKTKLLRLLEEAPALNAPYDILLRRFVKAGRLRAGVIFPFVTSAAETADVSQVQAGEHAFSELLTHSFRRLMFVDRDLEACRRTDAEIREALAGDEALLVGTVLAGFVSRRFVQK